MVGILKIPHVLLLLIAITIKHGIGHEVKPDFNKVITCFYFKIFNAFSLF